MKRESCENQKLVRIDGIGEGRAEAEGGCGESIREHDCISDASICRMHGTPAESCSLQSFVCAFHRH